MIYQIAIDGPTASGKGTVAKQLARKFGLLCLDTGAIYRGVTVYFLDHDISYTDHVAYNRALGELDLNVECIEGNTFIFLHGENITSRLRDNEVSNTVYYVARLPEVRAKVREIQERVSRHSSLVCEGRDITSVVFPNAKFKFYLTASVEERARRRFIDLQGKGENVPMEKLVEQIAARDHADMTREKSPLILVKGAKKIDASHISAYDVVKRMEKIITKGLMKCSSLSSS